MADRITAPVLDYPHIRQATRCPLCQNTKETGLLVCWSCYRRQNMRNGTAPDVARILDDVEQISAYTPTTPRPIARELRAFDADGQVRTIAPLADVLSRRTRAMLAAIEQRGGRQ